jgi:ribonuclease HI
MDEDGAQIASDKEYLGIDVSNNQAEYQGLLNGLEYMHFMNIRCETLYVRGDSEIVIRQMKGEYQVRSSNIRSLYKQIMVLTGYHSPADNINCRHIARGKNFQADQLANDAIDEE